MHGHGYRHRHKQNAQTQTQTKCTDTDTEKCRDTDKDTTKCTDSYNAETDTDKIRRDCHRHIAKMQGHKHRQNAGAQTQIQTKCINT